LFEIKSSTVSLPILKLLSYDLRLLAPKLREKILQAPDFFRDAPMAIDLHDLPEPENAIDFSALVRSMRSCGLVPLGVQGGSEWQQQAAKQAGLAVLPDSPRQLAQPKPPASKPPAAEPTYAKLVDAPVRSGQRIHAVGGDLVVLAQVSAGAEIVADGNIHVYGTLRGRALAGLQGNPACRIFCQDLQAELVAIGGHYKISENIDESIRGLPVQVYLKDNALIIEKI